MNKKGFTLTELLVSLSIFLIITTTVYLIFSLSQKAYKESQDSAEVTQNGRVIIERVVRELRQAKKIIGNFPEERESAVDEIIFENGHVEESYYYIRYFKDNNEIKREMVTYYFSGDSEEGPQSWDSVPPQGQTLELKFLELPITIGEWVNKLEFWGSETINISLTLEKKNKSFILETKIFSRNF